MTLMPAKKAKILKFPDKQGIRLDVGCGANKQEGFVGIDYRKLPGVDIVHNLEKTPWPLEDESVLVATASHVLEHIDPHAGVFMNVMDEIWRVLKPDGQFAFVVPYAGSPGYWQDPTHCLLPGAEVLTADGFKDMREVQPGEQLLTLRIEDGETEWSSCVRTINEPYSGDILRFRNRAIDIAVTANHDLVWKTWQPINGFHKSSADTFEEVGPFARRGLKTIPDWNGTDTDTGDFMELLGWILSEGSFTRRGNYRHTAIHQSKQAKPSEYQRINDLLYRMGFTYYSYDTAFNIRDDDLFDKLSPLGKQDKRYIPTEYKNQSIENLTRLLESLMLGDGEQHSSGGGHTYTTISERLAEDVSEIAVKCGMNAVIRKRLGKDFQSPNGKTYRRRDQYRVSVTYNNPMLYPKPEREHYDGNVVCVQVAENNTILTRYNGHVAWMGNCNGITEATLYYFDPLHESNLYDIYQPAPWKIEHCTYKQEGNLETVLRKRRDDKSYHSDNRLHYGKK